MNEITVAEFIEWLKTQDQGAIVQVVDHDRNPPGSYYCQGGTASVEDFRPELSEYTDFRGNQFIAPDRPSYNKRYLLIGRSD